MKNSIEDDSNEDDDEMLTYEELKQWKLNDLQLWLKKRGLPKSGTKHVLANRVLRCLKFGESDLSDDSDDEDEEDVEVKYQDFQEIREWNAADVDNLPPISDKDIEMHFLYSKSVTGKKKKCQRQLRKAERFSTERYVGRIEVHNDANDNYYVRACCKPSMKTKVPTGSSTFAANYSINVILSPQGKILQGSCNCKAGLSSVCSHVGGLLLTLVKIKDACTSGECQWNEPALQPMPPKRMEDINFYKEGIIKPYPGYYHPSCHGEDCSSTFLKGLLDGLEQERPSCLLYSILRSETDMSPYISEIYVPDFQFADTTDLSSHFVETVLQNYTQNLKVSKDQSERIEKGTRAQSQNKNWRETRRYVLTASNFGKITARRPTTDPQNLIKYMRSTEQIKTPPILYGCRQEHPALKAYRDKHVKKCQCAVSIERRGIYINPRYPFLGASIDGFVKCEKCGSGIVEVKCPYGSKKDRWRYCKVRDCCKNTKFFCKSTDDGISLKPKHYYMAQVQGQMALYELNWCDFFVFTKKDSECQRIEYDQQHWDRMFPILKDFFTYMFAAEVHSARILRNKTLFPGRYPH